MIFLPEGPEEAADDASRLVEETEEFFRPGGRLQRACEGEPFPFEPRPQQAEMARAVARALTLGRHAAVEAGTGVGKSFAYLVPLILAARARGQKMVVATYTISLQEQLIHKDLPFLRTHLGAEFTAALVKGRGNYLCLRRLARSRRHGEDLFRAGERAWLERLDHWAAATEEGSLQNLPEAPPPAVWDAVCAEEGNCLGQKCPEFRTCFFMRARRRMQSADVLVANHHLLFSDLAMRQEAAGFLPDYAAVVLDEAHQVEAVASDHLGLRLTQYMFEHWLRRLYMPDTGKGLFGLLRHGEGARLAGALWDDVGALFKQLRDRSGLDEPRALREPLGIETPLTARLAETGSLLRKVIAGVEEPELASELKQARRRGAELGHELAAFLKQTLEGHVYWMELEGRRRQLVLHSAPVEVAPLLRPLLFEAIPTVVLTSATLAVNGSLDYILNRLGANGPTTDVVQVGSPFDFARQMRVILPQNLPEPGDTEEFHAAAARAILKYARRTRGSAFVLFTSARMLRTVADRLREPLAAEGLRLLAQGDGPSRHALLEDFRKGQGAVLFGLDSFWMGVDVRGEALSNVIIVKLPFAVPDQPLIQARLDRIKERGGEPFKEYSLPEAVIKFRQGVGRLIRTASDTGIVVVLDRRITGKWYGRWFLRALPECPIETETEDGSAE